MRVGLKLAWCASKSKRINKRIKKHHDKVLKLNAERVRYRERVKALLSEVQGEGE